MPCPSLCAAITAGLLGFASSAPAAQAQSADSQSALFAETFDAHWEKLRDDYPYFELYGVDWEAEREEHRPRAVSAADPDEFAWELARLIMSLPDPHVSFIPSMDTIAGRWSKPDVKARMIERRLFVVSWPAGAEPQAPEAFANGPHAYPEIIAVQGEPVQGVVEILAAGPVGTTFTVRLRWPDGSEADHELRRPAVSNLPPPDKHYGDRWLVTDRIDSVGYLRVRTFAPRSATLGPDGKMTTMLRAALEELADTDALVLDLQGNGGGLVAASDPFLGSFLERSQSYAWGNSGGRKRVIRPRLPRYRGDIVALVDAQSASGGEWAARILRDAGRATVVGERTAGAEAAVLESQGPDGSVVSYSGLPMVEPGVTPFQERGIAIDHAFPLTIADVREHGLEEALARVRRARFAKALELLDAPAEDVDILVGLADEADRLEEEALINQR